MSDLDQLEVRLSAALNRMDAFVDRGDLDPKASAGTGVEASDDAVDLAEARAAANAARERAEEAEKMCAQLTRALEKARGGNGAEDEDEDVGKSRSDLSDPRTAPDAEGAVARSRDEVDLANSELRDKVAKLEAELKNAGRPETHPPKSGLGGNGGSAAFRDGDPEAAEISNEGAQSLRRLLAVNEKLRDNNRKLRELNRELVGDPHLINAAMRAELEALKAARQADRDELDSLVLNWLHWRGRAEMDRVNIKVKIGGRAYTLACQEGEEDAVRMAVETLDVEVKALTKEDDRLTENQTLLIAGLVLADKVASLSDDISKIQTKLTEAGARIKELSAADGSTAQSDVKAIGRLLKLVERAEKIADRAENRSG